MESSRGEPALGDRVRARERGRGTSSGSSRSTRLRCRRRSPARGRARSRSGTSSATSSTATASSRSSRSGGATPCARLPEDTTLVVNADDPVVGDLAEGRRQRPPLRPRRPATCAARPPARGRLEVLRPLRHAVRVRRRVRRPPRRVPLPGVRACSPRARRRREGHRADGPSLVPLHARRAGRRDRASSSRCPGLYNVYNATAAATPLPRARHAARVDPRGPRRVQRRIRPLRADRAGAEDDRHPPDQESRRGERGAAHARDRRAAGARDRAERRDRGRTGRVLDLGRRLRASPPPHPARRRDRGARGGARPPSALRRSAEGPARGRAGARGGARPRARADRAGGELVVLPTYTAMLALRALLTERGLVPAYWDEPR